MNNHHLSILKINSAALAYNLAYFKEKLKPKTKILAVVKAFAYGSDAKIIAKHLEKKVDYLAVAYVDEGIELREAGIEVPILVLHPQIQNLDLLINYQLEPNLYNFNILEAFINLADKKQLLNYPVHLKFNTGLNRLGFWHLDVPVLLSKLTTNHRLKIASLFSHLAASEDPNEKDFTINQINTFTGIANQVCKQLDYKPMLHILNTSGIINYPEAQFDLVRLGIGLYGFANDKKETKQLKNVFSLHSIISQIHPINPGESIGYNRALIAQKPMKSATIPIGHADGISRRLGNGNGTITINNQLAPIIGNVCMDMLMVDISNIDCKEGDEVIIFNDQEMIELLAEKTATIPYEIITGISRRIKRVIV